ncbi:MAG: hypothetical protein A2167_02310 [Planctomycetes bacterium RBG_13_46_10]|nr:MAG: hypothetical protein A2167_02310 [Planctomycetes bacterium RBG_13_46_10]
MPYLERNLSYINPSEIDFDPHNPRGETEKQITSDKDFKRLVVSVKEFGVLEPIIVRKNGENGKLYILVDGERRWRASLKANLSEVPARIAKDEINGRILAYQVHKLRKDWTKITETKSIKTIISEIKEEQQGISEAELRKRIREITNSPPGEIRELLHLLKYDDDIIEQVIEGKTELQMSHLIQIEQSFMPKLKKKFPEIIKEYGEHDIRHILANKAAKGLLGGTRYIMDTFKYVFKHKEHHDEIRDLLVGFLQRKSEDIKDAFKKFQEITQELGDKGAKGKKKKKAKAKRKTIKKGTFVPPEVDQKSELVQIESDVISKNVFDLLFNYMREAVIDFEKRSESKFKDEPELQNFIYSVLRAMFMSVEFEDPTEKMCGKFNRLDFVLKDHKIIIEIKYVRDKTHAKKISEELSVDYLRYKQSPYGQTIINYIYDPNNHITNHGLYKKQLNKILRDAHNYIQ